MKSSAALIEAVKTTCGVPSTESFFHQTPGAQSVFFQMKDLKSSNQS